MASGQTKRSASRAALIPPVFCAGLLIAGMAAWMSRPRGGVPVSHATAAILHTALMRADQPGVQDGGVVGPWWISAATADPETGKLHHLHINSGVMEIAARTATLIINAEDDSLAFELEDVVMTRPATGDTTENDDGVEGTLLTLEEYVLGPVPYGRRIVND